MQMICLCSQSLWPQLMIRIPLFIGLVMLTSVMLSSTAQGHSADTFTVVIKESGLTPASSQIAYNDSVVWHNTDARDNITHRIVFDFDGDGLYNGSDDWDSGELVSECETNGENSTENGSDSGCNVTFMVWFNGTWGVGEYHYLDMLSDGSVMNGTIVVTEDVHVENSTSPAIGSSFGVSESANDDNNDHEEDGGDERARRLLLLIGGGSGLGALTLIVVLLMRRS